MSPARSVVLVGALAAASLFASPAAAVTVTEPPDLSNSVATPTPVTLTVGANTVSGTVTTPGDRQDNFTVTVPAGTKLTAASLTLDTSSGFVGSVTFNLSEVRTSSGSFTTGFPFAAGTYYVQVISDFAVGNAWSMSFTVATVAAVCNNGVLEAGEACDDGNSIVCDGCSPSCTVTTKGCLVGGVCVAEGTPSPGNACKACRGSVSRTGYSNVVVGTPCDDGAYCTVSDACNASGVCTGTARACGDTLSCTTDACDEAADACTHVVASGCLIGGACIASGAIDPANGCRACQPAMSTTTYTPRALGTTCDDGSYCTVSDTCNGAGVCNGVARTCDDGNACTFDSCNEAMDICVSTPIPSCPADAGADSGSVDSGSADSGSADSGADSPSADSAADAESSDADEGVLDAADDGSASDSAESDTAALDGGEDVGEADAGDTGTAADAVVGDDESAAPDPTGEEGGCGCRTAAGAPDAASGGLTALTAALLLACVRRRSSRGRNVKRQNE